MILSICPKLPMRNPESTKFFYTEILEFQLRSEYPNYLIFSKNSLEIHFFLHTTLQPLENDGQVYCRVKDISEYFHSFTNKKSVYTFQLSPLERKLWGVSEFSVLDPDHNLLTFGEID